MVAAAIATMIASGCGGSGSETSAESRAATDDGDVLTSDLPRNVVTMCDQMKGRAEALGFVCPPLIPSGPADVQVGLVTPEYYEVSFSSPRLGEEEADTHFGHWLIQGGDRESVLAELGTNTPGGLPRPTRQVSLLGTPASVYRIGDYQNVNKGHVLVLWESAGKLYDVSVHGKGSEDIVLEMARGMVSCQGGDRPGTDC